MSTIFPSRQRPDDRFTRSRAPRLARSLSRAHAHVNRANVFAPSSLAHHAATVAAAKSTAYDARAGGALFGIAAHAQLPRQLPRQDITGATRHVIIDAIAPFSPLSSDRASRCVVVSDCARDGSFSPMTTESTTARAFDRLMTSARARARPHRGPFRSRAERARVRETRGRERAVRDGRERARKRPRRSRARAREWVDGDAFARAVGGDDAEVEVNVTPSGRADAVYVAREGEVRARAGGTRTRRRTRTRTRTSSSNR